MPDAVVWHEPGAGYGKPGGEFKRPSLVSRERPGIVRPHPGIIIDKGERCLQLSRHLLNDCTQAKRPVFCGSAGLLGTVNPPLRSPP